MSSDTAVLMGLALGAGLLIVLWPHEGGAPIDGEYAGADAGDPLAWLPELSLGGLTEQAETVIDSIFSTGPKAGEYGAMSGEANVNAFLLMIRTAEGTSGPLGYRTMFGGGTFESYAAHPNVKVTRTFNNGKRVTSTAAGAYQFLIGTWNDCKRQLGLTDFSPASQDAAAVYLLKRRGALADVRAGRFDAAIRKTAREWASLPGSPYGQPTITMARAEDLFEQHGGTFA
jgi:muramidase (phage lysozyme)